MTQLLGNPTSHLKIADVNIHEYITEEEIENNHVWDWIEANASFKHVDNNEPGGSFDFIFNTSVYIDMEKDERNKILHTLNAPEIIIKMINEAIKQDVAYICFNPGT